MEYYAKHLSTFFLFSLLTTTLASSREDHSVSKPNHAEFIKTSCHATTYPELCVASLSAHATAIRSSPELIAATALRLTLSSAKATSASLARLSLGRGLSTGESAAMRDCVEELADSVEELRRSMAEMVRLKGSPSFKLMVNDIQTWVSAALTDENTCAEGFDDESLSGSLKGVVKGKIVNVAQLTSNALALINMYALIHG